MKNLYLISQTRNTDYDTYDSAVVCASSATSAKKIHPDGDLWDGKIWPNEIGSTYSHTWPNPGSVKVKYLGTAAAKVKLNTVICASFNAG